MDSKQLGIVISLSIAALGCADRESKSQTHDAGREAGSATGLDAGVDTGAPESGVDPALRLVELPSDLAARVCSAWSARLDRLVPRSAYVEASCTQQAWPLSADAEFKPSQPRCQELRAMCVASGGALGGFTPAQSIGADLIDPVRCVSPLAGLDIGACDATVGDLEACSTPLSAAVSEHIKLITCDALLDPSSLDRVARDVDLSVIPECQALQARCPAWMFYGQLDGKPPL
jgi:hypothetical protein